MNLIKDCLNRIIRVTDERLQHIKEHHPELSVDDLDKKIAGTLEYPDIILSSISYETAELFYKYFSTHRLVINGFA